MLSDEMQSVVEKQRLGFVATVCQDGTPNLSPKGTFVVIDAHTLAFGELRSPGTIANLEPRPGIEVNFVDPLSRKGLRAKGLGVFHPRGTPKYEELIAHFERWGDLTQHMNGVVEITVESAQHLTSPAYDYGATEEELRAQFTEVLLS